MTTKKGAGYDSGAQPNLATSPRITDRPPIIIWPRTSRLTACGTCRDQLRANDYAARMRLFERAAQEFHQRELGRAYVPFEGVAA